jgi:hypothetical protein
MPAQYRRCNMRSATSKEDGMEIIVLSIALTLALVIGHFVATVTD